MKMDTILLLLRLFLHDTSCLYYDEKQLIVLSYGRGMVYVDGKGLSKSESIGTGKGEGAFWIEENGLCLHVRFEDDGSPEDHTIEITTKEQVFVPEDHIWVISG